MTLGERIIKLRNSKGISQDTLALALGVSRQSVSKWETDTSIPELDKLVKMAHIFGITLDEMVSGKADSSIHTPPNEPQQPSRRLTNTQILGIVLLVFGGLCFIVFTVVGIFVGGLLLGLAISIPFLLCGLICLLCKKNIGLKCAWAVYLPLWLILTVLMGGL